MLRGRLKQKKADAMWASEVLQNRAIRRRSDTTSVSGHDALASGAQDQPEQSEASTDKLIDKNSAPRRPKRH